MYAYISVLISSYGAPLGTAHFSLWASGAVNYDCIVIKSLLIGPRCIPNGTHTNHC